VSLEAIHHSQVTALLASLPPLPSSIRYYDDFFDTYRSIRQPGTLGLWSITTDGQTREIDFDKFDHLATLTKHIVAWQLITLDSTTVIIYSDALSSLPMENMIDLIGSMLALRPYEVRDLWVKESAFFSTTQAAALKSYLFGLCALNIGPWKKEHRDYVALLSMPKRDKYRVVRTGDCFVPLDQQSLLIDYFDELSLHDLAAIGDEELRDACILAIVFQHAFRPGQVARLKTTDVRLYSTGAVHFSALLIKKRSKDRGRRVSRRIKREWCSLFIEYSRRRSQMVLPQDVPQDSYFGLIPAGVGRSIMRGTDRIIGEKWSATDLRHTAAQRLVDAGASHIVVSEFLGHSSLGTANVYIDTSPTQAQRVNQALAISPIYSEVAKVARTRTIDKAALLRLPPDKQIGGVPHGIPIAGIGGCSVGQSLCVKNPVLNCYTCRKFMPVSDAAIHRHVAEELRLVVVEFARASRGNIETPAYTQLRRMLTAVEAVVADVEETGR
jgi:Site-specific recombinase XerD